MNYCPNCRESLAEPAMYEGDLFVAVECPVCGVRGPVRSLLNKDRFDQVAKLATDDWNLLFRRLDFRIEQALKAHKPESNETSDTGEDVAPSSKQPAVDTPASQAVTSPPPGDGGESDSGVSWEQADTADRLARFLGEIGIGAETAVKRGMNFGVSHQTLYNMLSGKKVSDKTWRAVNAALDRMERSRALSGAASKEAKAQKPSEVAGYDESKVEQIPNKFQDPTGFNRCPKPTAPPRCARTP